MDGDGWLDAGAEQLVDLIDVVPRVQERLVGRHHAPIHAMSRIGWAQQVVTNLPPASQQLGKGAQSMLLLQFWRAYQSSPGGRAKNERRPVQSASSSECTPLPALGFAFF